VLLIRRLRLEVRYLGVQRVYDLFFVFALGLEGIDSIYTFAIFIFHLFLGAIHLCEGL